MNTSERYVVGDEFDQERVSQLFNAIRGLGGTELSRIDGVAGSQDYLRVVFDLDGQELVVEVETYVGASVTGPSAAVGRVRSALGAPRPQTE